MSVYNSVRKHKLSETNLKSEEIINFYKLSFRRIAMFCFSRIFTVDWWACWIEDMLERNLFRYPRIRTVSHWQETKMENSATYPAQVVT